MMLGTSVLQPGSISDQHENFPSLDLAYERSLLSYQEIGHRYDAVNHRLDVLMTLTSTVTLAAPIIVAAGAALVPPGRAGPSEAPPQPRHLERGDDDPLHVERARHRPRAALRREHPQPLAGGLDPSGVDHENANKVAFAKSGAASPTPARSRRCARGLQHAGCRTTSSS